MGRALSVLEPGGGAWEARGRYKEIISNGRASFFAAPRSQKSRIGFQVFFGWGKAGRGLGGVFIFFWVVSLCVCVMTQRGLG